LPARGGGPDLDDEGDNAFVVSGGGSCCTRASKRTCRCAENHQVGWRLYRRSVRGGEPSCPDSISLRKYGLRRSRPLRSPWCSIPRGQS
jgi:hypothetical protein